MIASGAYTQEPGSNALAARECGLGETSAVDLLDPASGQVAFLLVSGNSAAGESGIGTDASGSIRTNTLPCL